MAASVSRAARRLRERGLVYIVRDTRRGGWAGVWLTPEGLRMARLLQKRRSRGDESDAAVKADISDRWPWGWPLTVRVRCEKCGTTQRMSVHDDDGLEIFVQKRESGGPGS